MPEQPGPAVTITKQADGSYSVAPETDEAATTAETPAMEGQEAGQGQTAKTLDEALDLARAMLEGGADEGMSVEQAFSNGFEGQPGH